MLSKNLPITQPAKLKGFGHPWHGKVQNSTLTAADGTTRAYTQPTGGKAYQSGATNLIKAPGAPGGATLITKAGQEWTDYGMLAGEDHQLYETALGAGKWIYVDPAGDRWLVDFPLQGQSVDLTAPMATMLTLSRFGVIGGQAESHQLPVTLSDLAQGTPEPIPSTWNGDVSVTTATATVESTDPAGANAVVMLSIGAFGAGPIAAATQVFSVGFLKVGIAGTPGVDTTATLSVLRTRAQTMGAYQEAQFPSSLVTQYMVVDEEHTTDEVGGPPTCTGHFDDIYTPTLEFFTSPPIGSYYSIQTGPESGSAFNTGRIVALAYDSAGVLHEWTIDSGSTVDIDNPLPSQRLTGDGRKVVRTPYTGGGAGGCNTGTPVVIEDYTREIKRANTSVDTGYWALKIDGAVVAQWSATATVTDGQRLPVKPSGSHEETITQVYDITGAGGGHSENSFTISPSPLFTRGAYPAFMLSYLGVALDAARVRFNVLSVGYSFYAGVLRYSNNLLGTVTQGSIDFAYYDPAAPYFHAGAGSPGALDATVKQLTGLQPYGSWNPATGEAIFAEPNPVCWV